MDFYRAYGTLVFLVTNTKRLRKKKVDLEYCQNICKTPAFSNSIHFWINSILLMAEAIKRGDQYTVGIFQALKAQPKLPEMEDEESVNASYKHWRIRIFYSMFFGYAFFYITRRSLGAALPLLLEVEEYGFTRAQLGILGTVMAASYAVSKFLAGLISDQSNPRYFLPLGLIATGIANFFFGMSTSIWGFAIWWGINGVFQGFGWPACARLLRFWYSQSERGRWWGIWGISHNAGGAFASFVLPLLVRPFGWQFAMYIPAVISILMGLWLINRLRDTPESLGLPAVEKFRNDEPDGAEEEDEGKAGFKKILIDYVFKNPYVWILAASLFFVLLLRNAITDWAPIYLREMKGYSYAAAVSCVGIFDIGGTAGHLFAGWASDRLFKGKRIPLNVFFMIGLLAALTCFWILPSNGLIDTSLMFVIGFCIYGPHMLLGMAVVELTHKKAAGTASGFASGWVAYVGAMFAGYPIGKIIDIWGWYGYFLTLAVSILLVFLLIIPIWNASKPYLLKSKKIKA